jgi:hypothetical protein
MSNEYRVKDLDTGDYLGVVFQSKPKAREFCLANGIRNYAIMKIEKPEEDDE